MCTFAYNEYTTEQTCSMVKNSNTLKYVKNIFWFIDWVCCNYLNHRQFSFKPFPYSNVLLLFHMSKLWLSGYSVDNNASLHHL